MEIFHLDHGKYPYNPFQSIHAILIKSVSKMVCSKPWLLQIAFHFTAILFVFQFFYSKAI